MVSEVSITYSEMRTVHEKIFQSCEQNLRNDGIRFLVQVYLKVYVLFLTFPTHFHVSCQLSKLRN